MRPTYDVIVAGAGVLGLWITVTAARAGLKVLLIEKHRCGEGASATPLGALMPHLPGSFDTVKQLQWDGLVSLPDVVAALEAETGSMIDYRRCGRLIPLRDAAGRTRMTAAADAASTDWRTAETGFAFTVDRAEDLTLAGRWLSPDHLAAGVAGDTLTAVIDAGGYLAALCARARRTATVMEGTALGRWDDASGTATDPQGGVIACAGALVIAAGYDSYDLAADRETMQGGGVKGQIALVTTDRDLTGLPVVFDKGLMIVPRTRRTVAVGATTDPRFTDPAADPQDGDTLELIARARRLMPTLRTASIERIWAGIRPRSTDRRPKFGRLPHSQRTWVATGGYKITLAIAHVAADWLVADLLGSDGQRVVPAELRPGTTISGSAFTRSQ